MNINIPVEKTWNLFISFPWWLQILLYIIIIYIIYKYILVFIQIPKRVE